MFLKSFIWGLLFYSLFACQQSQAPIVSARSKNCDFDEALLASRIKTLEEFKQKVKLQYFNGRIFQDLADSNNKLVRLEYCIGPELLIVSELEEGIDQSSIQDALNGGFKERVNLLLNSPFAVSNRNDLQKVSLLARKRYDLFGWGDVAFYNLAESASRKIYPDQSAFQSSRDKGEKGYINSFNHITAQALITSLFSEELADYVAKVHERYNMPELTNGLFSEKQLTDSLDNPVDNYIDLLNNEIGQELGKKIKAKYSIDHQTFWTPNLLTNILNDLQAFYKSHYRIQMKPFRAEERIVIRFAEKLNQVLSGKYKNEITI